MPTITIPYNYQPRPYQLPLLRAMDSGYKRAVVIWHRRAGKDKTVLQIVIKKMLERVGSYYYFFPTYKQAKKILWDGMDRDGFRFLDHFPKELIDGKPNETEMKIKFRNGSLFQIIGTDNIDSVVGSNPIGCVFSEYSLQNPQAWSFIRPILKENGGWALFVYTPRGKNHGYDLYQMAKKNPDWFSQVLTVRDTGVVSEADIQQERDEGMDEDLIQQEYYCSFEGSLQGAYYGKQMRLAEAEGRIGNVPYDEMMEVDTWWDLGIDDCLTIWFSQSVGREIRFIDYLEVSGEGFSYIAKELKDKPYVYGRHHLPFDAKVRELGTGKSRLEIAESLGIRPIDIVDKLPIDEGINAARMIFGQCWFDAKKCERGIDALRSYHKEFDDERKIYKNKPEHDWSSHGADSFRYMAVGYKGKIFIGREDRRRIYEAETMPDDPFSQFLQL